MVLPRWCCMSRFKSEGQPEWERHVEAALSLFGHRNWIVVADAAYPAQARPGIRTLLADMDHFEVVEKVLGMILASRHVRPRIYLDRELAFVAEQDAPGVEDFRHQLAKFAQGQKRFAGSSRTDHSQARSVGAAFRDFDFENEHDHPVHICLLRTRLRLLASGRGRAAPRSHGCLRTK